MCRLEMEAVVEGFWKVGAIYPLENNLRGKIAHSLPLLSLSGRLLCVAEKGSQLIGFVIPWSP